MKVMLGNLKWWRFKNLLVIFICMGGSLAVVRIVNNDNLSGAFLLAGLVVAAVISESSWINSTSCQAYAEDRGTEIYIKKKGKEYTTRKEEIKKVIWKEISYGGRWLDTIGYRLIVTADRKYVFDSVLIEEDADAAKNDLKKLYHLFS